MMPVLVRMGSRRADDEEGAVALLMRSYDVIEPLYTMAFRCYLL